nr:hypothetical protein NCPCFENI_01198 [Cupriavidus sp.]
MAVFKTAVPVAWAAEVFKIALLEEWAMAVFKTAMPAEWAIVVFKTAMPAAWGLVASKTVCREGDLPMPMRIDTRAGQVDRSPKTGMRAVQTAAQTATA